MKIKNVLRLEHAAQQACLEFARHLSGCDICTVWRSRSGITTNLCAAGLEANDKSNAAWRAYHEQEKRNN